MNRFRSFTALPAAFAFLTATAAFAQNMPNAPRIIGVITSVARNRTCFQVSDYAGNSNTVTVDKDTTYSFGQTPSDFDNVLCVGDLIVATLAPDGIATSVSNRNRSRSEAQQLRSALQSTDDEWTVIAPLLTKVLECERTVAGRGQSDLRNAINDLRSTLNDPDAGNWDIMSKLKALRVARAKAQADLDKARQDLVVLLTPRQEAVLVEQGVLN